MVSWSIVREAVVAVRFTEKEKGGERGGFETEREGGEETSQRRAEEREGRRPTRGRRWPVDEQASQSP